MDTSNIPRFAALFAATALVSSTHAAVLNVPNYSLTPDGTNDSPVQTFDFAGGVGANSIVNASSPIAYFVTTFSFGTDTLADLQLNFTASGGQDRLGVHVNDDGTFETSGDGTNGIDFDLSGSLAGQTVIILGKFEFDANYSTTYGRANASEDSFATFWINPTLADTEGSGRPDGADSVANANFTGDFASNLWNSSSFYMLESRIFNNSTPGTSGDSGIVNTTLLTGADATFANALAIATIPEPSTALLGGLGLLGLLRRRR